MEQNEIKRSEAYIELRNRLYAIYYNAYIIARLDMPTDISRLSQAKKIRKSRKELWKKIQALVTKWKDLTKAECGEEFTLKGLKHAASSNGSKAFKQSQDKEALRAECESKLAELMPNPKRKRITAVKVGR